MRRRVVVSVVAALLALAVLPASSFAAASPDPGSKTQVYTQTIPIPQDQCQAMADADPQHSSAILSHCYVTRTTTVSPLTIVTRSSSGVQAAAASGCQGLATGSSTNDWGMWRLTVTAQYWVDICNNNVRWNWVHCDWAWVFPWTLNVTWCGAYPGTGVYRWYQNTNVGINYVASTPLGGASHGFRWGIRPNPYSYWGIFSW